MTGHWHRHPGVRSGVQLSRGERAADRLRNSMGSWGFVFTFLAFMLAWAGLNTWLLRDGAFDAYPYILLNLLLSTLAGLQGGILLIAAKRSDQVSGELAQHDYLVNVASLRYHAAQSEVLLAVALHLQIPLTDRQQEALISPPPVPLPPDPGGVV